MKEYPEHTDVACRCVIRRPLLKGILGWHYQEVSALKKFKKANIIMKKEYLVITTKVNLAKIYPRELVYLLIKLELSISKGRFAKLVMT